MPRNKVKSGMAAIGTLTSPCEHPDLRGTPLYFDGRKVWICTACGARVVHEDGEVVGTQKLVPLVWKATS